MKPGNWNRRTGVDDKDCEFRQARSEEQWQVINGWADSHGIRYSVDAWVKALRKTGGDLALFSEEIGREMLYGLATIEAEQGLPSGH